MCVLKAEEIVEGELGSGNVLNLGVGREEINMTDNREGRSSSQI